MKKNEKFYEKYAWTIFVIIGLLITLGGIPHMLGMNTDPGLVESISGETIDSLQSSSPMHFNLYDFYFRSGGMSDIGVAFFIIIIAVFSYRKREKWAWFALCFVPVFFLSYIGISLTLTAKAQEALIPALIVFALVSLVGLLLPIRIFFPSSSLKN